MHRIDQPARSFVLIGSIRPACSILCSDRVDQARPPGRHSWTTWICALCVMPGTSHHRLGVYISKPPSHVAQKCICMYLYVISSSLPANSSLVFFAQLNCVENGVTLHGVHFECFGLYHPITVFSLIIPNIDPAPLLFLLVCTFISVFCSLFMRLVL